jgi:UDP-N-acetyl-D-glucosamine/UDP-N-acetyl-D-galactosamine dehydrogenase
MINNLRIGIIGLGYVGLPLFLEFSKKFEVKGFDLSMKKINFLKKKIDYTNQFTKKDLQIISNKNINYKSNILKDCNFFIVTVPTPITKNKIPDLSAVISATKIISKYIKKNDYVVYESTFYPGVTEDICVKIIEQKTKLVGINNNNINNKKLNGFNYGYSPERINPGDLQHGIKDIIKITSGATNSSAKFIDSVYKKICLAGTYKAQSIKIAESAKVIENTQRDINIALINEFAQIFSKMNINIYDVLYAAKTKWNFLDFSPGLVGGHCIGVDPYYLTYKASKVGYNSVLTLAGRKLNDNMHIFILKKLYKYLDKNFKKKKYKLLLIGLTFKENVNDFRNSRSIVLANEIKKHGHTLDVFDNNVSIKEFKKENKLNIINKPKKNFYDGVLITVAHEQIKKFDKDYLFSLLKDKEKGKIFDVKNIFNQKKFLTI